MHRLWSSSWRELRNNETTTIFSSSSPKKKRNDEKERKEVASPSRLDNLFNSFAFHLLTFSPLMTFPGDQDHDHCFLTWWVMMQMFSSSSQTDCQTQQERKSNPFTILIIDRHVWGQVIIVTSVKEVVWARERLPLFYSDQDDTSTLLSPNSHHHPNARHDTTRHDNIHQIADTYTTWQGETGETGTNQAK